MRIIMAERVIAGGRVGKRTPVLPRIACAVALSAAVITEGCMAKNYPECGFYFRGENAQKCDTVRGKLKEARGKLKEVGEREKLAAAALRKKIASGQDCREELGKFNTLHAEIRRISRKLDGYRKLEMEIRDGNAKEGQVGEAFEEINAIWGKILEIGQVLERIGRNI